MSDYDSSGSSSDDSDEDLFDVCLPTQYPYRPPRVDPERYQCGPIPTLGSGAATYQIRGFVNVAASQQWSPTLDSVDALSSFLLYARRLHRTLSMSQLLDLVRESGYDLGAAQAALLAPMLEPSRPPDDSDRPWDEAAAKEEVRRVMAKMTAHRNIKQTARQIHRANAAAASASASMEESNAPAPLVPAAAVAAVASANERCEECAWTSSAQTAAEAINAALNALAKGATNAQSSSGTTVPAAVKGAKGASVKKEAAVSTNATKKAKGKNAAAPSAPPSTTAAEAAPADGTAQMTVPSIAAATASLNDDEEDGDDGKEVLDEGAASDAEGGDAPSAASQRAHSPSFLYPWMVCACASSNGTAPGAHEPSVARIDVMKLRDIIQIVADAEHDATAPPGTPPLPVMSANAAQWAAALSTVSSAHLAVLQSLLCGKNEWLDRVRPVLNSISRAKDNQTLVQILELLRELEAAAPGVDSRERRKCISIVHKVQEWRLQCQRMFKQATTVAALKPDGMLEQQPQSVQPPAPLSLSSLSLQLKECDRACGPVASDESVFLRTVYDYVFNFVRQVECMVAVRLPEEDRVVVETAETQEEEVKQEDASAAPAAGVAAPSLPSDEADMDTGEQGEEEGGEGVADSAPARRVREARRNHAVLSRNSAPSDASPSPVPSNGVAAIAVPVANDYPREAGSLPQKLLLTHAKLRLSRFHSRFAFHFAVPQAALLRREIDRAESWLSNARAALQHTREADDPIAPWIHSLESLLEGVDSLSLAVDASLADSVVKGLKGRLWVAKVDQAFQVDTTHAAAAPAALAAASGSAPAAAGSMTKASASSSHPRRGPPLQRVYDLLAEALEIPIPPTVSRYQKLESVLRDAQACIDRAATMLAPKTKAPMSEWQALLDSIRTLPVHLDEEARLERVMHNTVEWHRKVDAFLSDSLQTPPSVPSDSLHNRPVPALAPRAPHSLPFDGLESLIHRTTGKNLALISDECANPADNSEGYAQLRLLLRVGRAWCQEVTQCFQALSTGSAGRKSTGGAAGAGGAAKKGAAGSAGAGGVGAHEHMDRYALMARLKQLLGLYTCRDAELEADDEEAELSSPEAQPDTTPAAPAGATAAEGAEAAKPSEVAVGDAAMKDSSDAAPAARAASASPVTSPPPAVSLPSTDAASWSWLSRYQIDPSAFESLLPQLELKMADRLSDRLSLVSESLAMAWNALRGPRRCTLIELKQLVHQLQQSGELNTAEPLRTLIARLKLAQTWRSQARKLLPPQYMQEVRRRHKRRRTSARDMSQILPSPLHTTRAPRRTRKKAASAATGLGGGFDPDHDESDGDDDGGAAHVSSIDQLDFSDEDEEELEERVVAEQGVDGESGRRIYRAALIDLLHLHQQYHRFAQRRQQHGGGDGAGVPLGSFNALSARPVTPNASGGAALQPDDLDEESLGLDLVDLDELEALQLCIDECTALQRKAIDTLAQPSCAALAAKLSHAQPLFTSPKLPVHLLSEAAAADAIRPVTPHTLSSGADGLSVEAEEASMSALRALLAEVEERDVCIAIPEIEQLAHLSWVRDWIGQAQRTLALCHKAYAASAIANAAAAAAIKDEPVDAGTAAVAAAAAAAAGSSTAAASASFAAAVPPSEQVTLDTLVALLRAVRLQFGPEQYIPLVSHLQLLRAQQHARSENGSGGAGGGHGAKADGDSEGEEEQDEGHREQPQPQSQQAQAAVKPEDVKLELQASHEPVAPSAATAAANAAPPSEQPAQPLPLEQPQAPAADSAVKMELDQPAEANALPQNESVKMEALVPDASAIDADGSAPAPPQPDHAPVAAGGEGQGQGGVEGEDSQGAHFASPDEFQLHPFLDVFRFDLQHLEFYLYELLNSSHKLRQLFERRLGTQHTNLLLGPPREELLMWVADAAEEAGINVAATLAPSPEPAVAAMATGTAGAAPAPGSGATPSPAPVAESGGYGLLATSRRLKLQRARERMRIGQRPVVPSPRDRRTTPSVYHAEARNVQLASPLPVVAPVATAEPIRKSEGGRAAGGARKKVKTEAAAAEEDTPVAAAAGVKAKRQRKSKGVGAAPASAADAAGVASAGTGAVAVAADSHAVDDSLALDGSHGGAHMSDEEPDSTLYCLCQRPYTEGDLMISCDVCAAWFHTSCLNLNKIDIKRVTESKFMCPACARAANKTYKFRDKVPHHRKARARGPKLASLQALLAKMPQGLVCEEGMRAEAIMQRAVMWARAAEYALTHPPNDQAQTQTQTQANNEQTADLQMAAQIMQQQQPPQQEQQQQQAPASTVAPDAAAPSSTDVSGASADVVMHAPDVPSHVPTATTDAVFAAAAAAAAAAATPPQPMEIATHHASSAAASTAPPLSADPSHSGVETILRMECQSRERYLRQRQRYTDEMAELLRSGMGLPLELTQRRLVEERIRLLLNLEKAERILLDNVTVPLMPNSTEQEAALERAMAAAAASADGAAGDSVGAAPASAGGSSKEREQVSLTPGARKHELKEIGTVHTELQRGGAATYLEGSPAQDAVWPRFDSFVTRLQAWIDKTTAAMYKAPSPTATAATNTGTDTGADPAANASGSLAGSDAVAGASATAAPPTATGATLQALLQLQSEFKNHFLMVVCPTATDLAKRIGNIIRWMPKEKRALAKGLRSTQLWKLQLERVNDCGISNSPYTLQIQAACVRCEDWLKRLHAGMDSQQGPAFFRALLHEAQEAPDPVLVDQKDIRLCEGFTRIYCRCRKPYVDGVFMIACDQCEDWFHETCVGLTQKVAEKIKNYKCPRCCEADGVPYKYAASILPQPSDAAPQTTAAGGQQQQSQLSQQQVAQQQQQQVGASGAGAAGAPASSAMAIPATTVSSALVGPSGLMGAPAGWTGMDAAMAGIVWPGGNMAQMMLAQQHAAQQHHHQQQQQQQQAAAAAAAQQAAHTQPAQPAVADKAKAGAAGSKKKAGGKAGAAAAAADADSRKRKRSSAASAHTAAGGEADDGKKAKKAKAPAGAVIPAVKEPSLDATAAALSEAASAAEAAGVVGPMSLAVLQHEHLMSVPLDAPPPRTAALYATLLYENLHVQVTPENSNVLWHLLNGYMSRMFDARLEEEILEAAKLVCGEQLLTDALLQVNPIYVSQVQLQWRQQQQQQANMLALQKAHAAGGAPAAAAAGGHQPRIAAPTPTSAVPAPAAAAAPTPVPSTPTSAVSNPAVAPAAASSPLSESDSDSESESRPAAARAKHKRKPKNYPRPALSAYKCFVRHLKATPASETGAAGTGAGASAGAAPTLLHNLTALAVSQGKSVNKLMSEKWRAMSKENRQHFEDESLAERQRFDAQMAKWNAKHATTETQAAAPAPQTESPTAGQTPAPDQAPAEAQDQLMTDVEQQVAAAAAAATSAAHPAPAAPSPSGSHPGDAAAPASVSPPTVLGAGGVGGLHPYTAHLMGGALKAGVVAGPSQAIVHASLPHPAHGHAHPHLMTPGLYPPPGFHSPAFQHYITQALQQQAAAAAHREQFMQQQQQQQLQQQQQHTSPLPSLPAAVSAPVTPHDSAPLPSLPSLPMADDDEAAQLSSAADIAMVVEAANVAAAAAEAARAAEP